ncbi:MAG: 6-carboxytetrahydropterin synthase [Chloroflexi bacterium]|nr:6-carboxytetrahydropterin synthase [Chloroflexota bacterium]
MGQALITRLFEFSASHHYRRPEWSRERNRQVFGELVNSHGHNYLLEMSVTGPVDTKTGMVINLTQLKDAVDDVLKDFDHKNLNEDLPYFKERIPTLENLAAILWQRINHRLPGATLARLRLHEDEDLFVDYQGALNPHPKAALSRRYTFSAAHQLYSPTLSPEQNLAVFGKCANPNGHGHNYELTVTVSGTIDPLTGMCADLAALDGVVQRRVIDRFDHKHLNLDVEDFLHEPPTGENIARRVWDLLVDQLPRGSLTKVKLVETRNNYFEYTGNEGSDDTPHA